MFFNLIFYIPIYALFIFQAKFHSSIPSKKFLFLLVNLLNILIERIKT